MPKFAKGNTTKRTVYSGEQRAKALGMIALGRNMSDVARELNVPRSTVLRWRDSGQALESRATISHVQQINLGEMIATFVHANLISLSILAQRFGERSWVKEQSAADLVAAYNAVADRTLQILASLQPAQVEPGFDPVEFAEPDPAGAWSTARYGGYTDERIDPATGAYWIESEPESGESDAADPLGGESPSSKEYFSPTAEAARRPSPAAEE